MVDLKTEPSSPFIQSPEHRPKSSIIIAEGIPLIDLTPINYKDEIITNPLSIEDLVKEIGKACKEWGFFQVINHKVPLDKRERIEESSKKFFGLSLEEKLKVRRDEVNLLGTGPYPYLGNIAFIPPSDDQSFQFQWENRWPHNPSDFREACEEYAEEVEKLAYKLMELIAMSLGLVPNRFRDLFIHNTSNIRLNHYPPCPYPHLALGLGRHKDTGVLTVLAQDDVGGLQVKRKSDGEWIQVKPIFNSFIINVGDMIQVWSNDAYESVEHRVMVNSKKDRLSIPFFLKPALYTDVKPLEELTNDGNPPKYSPINWGKFRTARMQSNFAKSNVDNLQIYHFKIS
ncbi:protein DMR6-LIKE OXYGENASE [Trifolium repens]|nr:protein DMR6-LIKE OXYGENASE [Trifolium repens]